MTKRLDEVPPEELAWLWESTYGPDYRVVASDIESSQVRHRLTVAGTALFDESARLTSFAVVKASATPALYSGQDPLRFHLSALALSTQEDGSEAIRIVERAALEAGCHRLAFGMDADHLLPGAPRSAGAVLSVLEGAGFLPTSECFDLERDLTGYDLPQGCSGALDDAGASVARCRSGDLDQLEGFLQREFPGRWHHDVMRKSAVDREETSVFLLWRNGTVDGFAMTQRDGCRRPVNGAVWRTSLGDEWGALGPIGVAKSARGIGLGDALLGSSLMGLAGSGVRRTIIDWTTLGDFYGAHGFSVTRRYRQYAKELA